MWTLAVDLVPTSILQRDPDKFGATVLSSPLVGPYATADARWIVLNMLDPERHWAPACRALGLEHLIDDADYATTASRTENKVALREIFVDAAKHIPRAYVYSSDYQQMNALMSNEIQKYALGKESAEKAVANAAKEIRARTGRK